MNFDLKEEQRMLQASLRRMLEDCDGSVWPQLVELGIFTALFNPQQGGLAGSGFDLAVVFEELGRAGVTDPVIESVLVCGRLIAEHSAESHKTLLARIIEGDTQLAFAHSEPTSRYDLNCIETRVNKHVLNGQKSVVVNAEAAEFLLVSARHIGDITDPNGIALYLVQSNTPGVTLHGYDVTGGGRAADVTFDNVQLAASDCLTEEASSTIQSANAAATVALCAETLGAMETALSMTCEYLNTRQQFGRSLASFQALSHRVVDMMIELEQARSAVILAAGHLEADVNTRELHISAAKNLLGRAGKLVAEESLQLHGGIGMTDEYRLGHFVKRIIMADHRFGDVDYHLERFIALDSAIPASTSAGSSMEYSK